MKHMKHQHNQPVDVLFVNPPSPNSFIYIRDINRHGRSSWERMIWPQTNLAYLCSMAQKVGLSVDIVDCIAENISFSEFKKILKECKPRYYFSNIISVTYTNDLKALALAKEISGCITVGMGPHITDSPARTLKEAEELDFVICHEAELTLEELLSVYEIEKPTAERLKRIAGIGFVPGRIQKGASMEPVITKRRPFVKDLDELPRPRHDLLPLDRYWAPFLGNYTFVEASRGCSYRCIFCRQAVMWQWKYRRRSGEALAEEALYVHSLGVDDILFHADTFTLDAKLVNDLCDKLIEAGSPFRWACNTHVKSLYRKYKLVEKMKKAGCWMIAIGIETADDQILLNIKKEATVAQAESVVKMIDEAGIEAWGYFVLGLPGETKETLKKTINFSLSVPLKIAKFDIGTPYPGTEFYNYAKEKGYLRVNHYEEFDQNASAVVEYPNLTRKEIKAAVRKGTLRFCLRPSQLFYIFREIIRPKSLLTIFLIIRDHILLLSSAKGGYRKSTRWKNT